MRIVICDSEASAKTAASMLKRNGGGGYKTVVGPLRATNVIVETANIARGGKTTYEFEDDDNETWVVVGHDN